MANKTKEQEDAKNAKKAEIEAAKLALAQLEEELNTTGESAESIALFTALQLARETFETARTQLQEARRAFQQSIIQ